MISGFTTTPSGRRCARLTSEVTCRWSRRFSADRAKIGMAAVGVTVTGSRPVLTMCATSSSTGSPPAGAKLSSSLRMPYSGSSTTRRCHSRPASTVRTAACPESAAEASARSRACCRAELPVTEHAPLPWTYSQKLRADFVLCRSSTLTGCRMKWCWPVFASPPSAGVTADIMPASLHNGNTRSWICSGWRMRNEPASSRYDRLA